MYISGRMKGVSAVIATIMMLVITIALAGAAYMYISGIFTQQTGKTVAFDEGATFCNATGIYVYVKNTGTQPYYKGNVSISLQGGTPQTCGNSPADNNVVVTPGGASVPCTNPITGTSQGFNTIVISGSAGGPTNTVKGSQAC